jgi:hypothetical protein
MHPLNKDEVLERMKQYQTFHDIEIGKVSFAGHVFDEPVNLDGAIFTDSAFFEGVQFRRGASFKLAKFKGPIAYFWRVRFFGDTNFWEAEFFNEANFSFTLFSSKADFSRVKFRGQTYFWRTLFSDQVLFEEAKFDDMVIFESSEYRVGVSKNDFHNKKLFEDLLKKEIITHDKDAGSPFVTGTIRLPNGRVASHKRLVIEAIEHASFDEKIQNDNQLIKHLEEKEFKEEERRQILEIWHKFSRFAQIWR